MIIELITQKKNNINVSFYDSASSTLIKNNFSIKTIDDIKSWKIKRDIQKVEFVISAFDLSKIKEIQYKFSGVFSDYTIEYSLDYINWFEFEYKTKNNEIFKLIDSSTNEYININDLSRTYDLLDMTYLFKTLNSYTKEYDYLYNSSFQFIKFTFFGVQASDLEPFYFEDLKIYIDETLDTNLLNKSLLSIISSNYYRSRIYEDQPFISDVMKTYLNMMEVNNIDTYDKIFLQKSDVNISELTV